VQYATVRFRGDGPSTPNYLGAEALTFVVKYNNEELRMMRNSRPVSWIKAARKDFEGFPPGAQTEMASALTILAEGRMPDIAKPLTGMGSGVMELALKHRGDAFRVVYALQIDTDIWVIHAFQKKSKSGIKTPKQEIDLIQTRLRQLRDRLK
jgi:phage-related protein